MSLFNRLKQALSPTNQKSHNTQNNPDAILLIHHQIGLLGSCYNASSTIQNIKQFINRARKTPIPIIHLRKQDPTGVFSQGSNHWRFLDTLKPLETEFEVTNVANDTFHETQLESLLNSLGVSHVIILGAISEFCVESTVRRAPALGFDVTLVGDCHATIDRGVLAPEDVVKFVNACADGFEVVTNDVAYRVRVLNGEDVDLESLIK